jgi:hypothetical protein
MVLSCILKNGLVVHLANVVLAHGNTGLLYFEVDHRMLFFNDSLPFTLGGLQNGGSNIETNKLQS